MAAQTYDLDFHCAGDAWGRAFSKAIVTVALDILEDRTGYGPVEFTTYENSSYTGRLVAADCSYVTVVGDDDTIRELNVNHIVRMRI